MHVFFKHLFTFLGENGGLKSARRVRNGPMIVEDV
jgi:hypothetical protein